MSELYVSLIMPSFINADLDIFSCKSLQPISDAWQNIACELYCGSDDVVGYFARFEVESQGDFNDPIKLINKFCDLIEALSDEGHECWLQSSKRIIDLGFQSDDKSNITQCQIPLEISKRMIKLGIEIHMSYYPLIDSSPKLNDETNKNG